MGFGTTEMTHSTQWCRNAGQGRALEPGLRGFKSPPAQTPSSHKGVCVSQSHDPASMQWVATGYPQGSEDAGCPCHPSSQLAQLTGLTGLAVSIDFTRSHLVLLVWESQRHVGVPGGR